MTPNSEHTLKIIIILLIYLLLKPKGFINGWITTTNELNPPIENNKLKNIII